jgi:hypothetical protein
VLPDEQNGCHGIEPLCRANSTEKLQSPRRLPSTEWRTFVAVCWPTQRFKMSFGRTEYGSGSTLQADPECHPPE